MDANIFDTTEASASQCVLLGCHVGFEDVTLKEFQITLQSQRLGKFLYAKTKLNLGFVLVHFETSNTHVSLPFLGFVRFAFKVQARVENLPEKDRFSELWKNYSEVYGGIGLSTVFDSSPEVVCCHVDSNEGRTISPVSRTIEQLFASKLGRSQKKNGANGKALKNENLTLESQENPGEGILGVEFSNEVKKNLEHHRWLKSKNALFIFFDSFQSVYMGHEKLNTQGPWPTGIPRFKSYAKAPSRSTLKLEEALAVFKAKSGNGNLVTSGMTAVDLGAAPGGWTFLLVRLGCFVTAIDNGALDQTLLASGMVDHFCEDAFKFKPNKPVDWLVCDMIEQPQKVAKLVRKWFELGWCNKAIVNLKLPMKQKLDAIDESLQVLQENAESNINERDLVLDIFWKHLYHDRDEVTLMITSNKISK